MINCVATEKMRAGDENHERKEMTPGHEDLRLPTERATLSQPSLASCRLAQHRLARTANDDCLGMGEHGGDGEAPWALDIHEVRVWRLHETLQLVPALLGGGRGVEEIDGKRHFEMFW